MNNETWRPVVGYEKIYQVSDLGRVRRVKTGRILRPAKEKNGYNRVTLCKEGNCRIFLVHRLMLIAFVGLPEPGQESNHKDGDRADNRLDNLEWLTSSENHLHKCRVLGKGRGELHNMAKLKNKDIPTIRRLLAEGKLLQREIGGIFGVSKVAIGDIKSGRTWAHI